MLYYYNVKLLPKVNSMVQYAQNELDTVLISTFEYGRLKHHETLMEEQEDG